MQLYAPGWQTAGFSYASPCQEFHWIVRPGHLVGGYYRYTSKTSISRARVHLSAMHWHVLRDLCSELSCRGGCVPWGRHFLPQRVCGTTRQGLQLKIRMGMLMCSCPNGFVIATRRLSGEDYHLNEVCK